MKIKNYHIVFLAGFLLLFSINFSMGQLVPQSMNVEETSNLLKGNPLDSIGLSGGIRATSTVYSVRGINQRRDPLNWQLNANIAVQTKFFTIPFSVQLSKQQRNFTHPFQQDFNQFGFSPTYKNVTLHLGYRSMSLSEFSLSGTQFLGMGIEYKNKNFPVSCALMYGRINKAFDGETTDNINISPDLIVYDRWAYGGRIQWGNDRNNIGLILFKAKDDMNSLAPSMATALYAKPAENLVTELKAQNSFSKRLTLKVDYAFSAYTRDINTSEITIDKYTYLNNLGGMFTPRASSEYNHAFVGEAIVSLESLKLNFKYRNIGPSFRTMGSPFLANDLDDFTAGTSLVLYKIVNLSFNGGLQRNNLRKTKASQSERIIGGANIGIKLSKRANVNLMVSNFSTKTQRVVYSEYNPETDMDSFSFQQVTRNASASSSIGFGKKIPMNLNLSVGYQNAFDSQNQSSSFYNASVNQSFQVLSTATQINFGVNFNQNDTNMLTRSLFGPMISVSQPLFQKKLRSTFTVTGQQALVSSLKESEFINSRLSFSYAIKNQHRFSLSTSSLLRKGYTENAQSFNEFRSTFTYIYNIKLN